MTQHQVIGGRSPEQCNDDALMEVHDLLTRDLAATCNGVLIYRGESARCRQALLDRCNRAIESGDSNPRHNMLTWHGLYQYNCIGRY